MFNLLRYYGFGTDRNVAPLPTCLSQEMLGEMVSTKGNLSCWHFECGRGTEEK